MVAEPANRDGGVGGVWALTVNDIIPNDTTTNKTTAQYLENLGIKKEENFKTKSLLLQKSSRGVQYF